MLDLSTLPTLFSLLIYALFLALLLLMVALPITLILKTEVTDFKMWWQVNLSDYSNKLNYYAKLISSLNLLIGRLVCWLLLTMVLMQFIVVLMRYVFAIGSIQMQESIWYMHGITFTLGVGYTLYRDRHVRVDVIYRNLSKRMQAWINLFGVLLFILPLCWVTLDIAYPYVANAWSVKEGSTEGSGLHYVYLIKSSILIFAVLLLLQGIALLLKSLSYLFIETRKISH